MMRERTCFPFPSNSETGGLSGNIRLKSPPRQQAPFRNPVSKEKPPCKILIAPCELPLKS